MYKIAVMGDYDSIYGFATLGLDTFPVDNLDYGVTLLKRLADGQLCSHIYDRGTGFGSQ